MTDAQPTTEPVADYAETGRLCPACGSPVAPENRFCPSCGAALPTLDAASQERAREAARRRLGGQTWEPAPGAGTLSADRTYEEVQRTGGPSKSRRHSSRRRRRRTPWYRRPLFVVPVLLLVAITSIAGLAAYRAQSTVSTLHDVSTPPPAVTDNTVDDDPVYAGIEVDTGPAMAALQAAVAGTPGAETGDSAGLFGSVRDAASDISDLANGAAIASGVTDGSSNAMTILLMGVDARPGAPIDIGVRPDSIMLLHIDPQAHSCRMLSVPRDTLVPLPGYGNTKVNHALMVGGIPYQQLVLEQYLRVQIDRYALVDFAGFETLVDAVGGIQVTVPQEIKKDDKVLFEAGRQEMNGEQALAYARYRGGADVDIGRIRRQQQIIRALAQEAKSRNLVTDVNSLLPAVESHIRTNFSTSELLSFADNYTSLCDVEGITLDTLQGTFSQSDTADPMFHERLYYNHVDEAVLREKVRVLLGG